MTRLDAASGAHYSKTRTKPSKKTALGAPKTGSKIKSKKQAVRKTSPAKPLESWDVSQMSKLVRSIGSSYEGAAVAMKENGIDGRFFLAMLADNDEDLTTSIADGGLGFTRLQLKRVMAQIEQHTY